MDPSLRAHIGLVQQDPVLKAGCYFAQKIMRDTKKLALTYGYTCHVAMLPPTDRGKLKTADYNFRNGGVNGGNQRLQRAAEVMEQACLNEQITPTKRRQDAYKEVAKGKNKVSKWAQDRLRNDENAAP